MSCVFREIFEVFFISGVFGGTLCVIDGVGFYWYIGVGSF